MINAHAVLFSILFFVGLWATIFAIISHVGGWASLAQQYRCSETFSGDRWYFQNGQMRWLAGYHNCLTVGADARGLYLAMLFPFRIAHPSLLIPWSEISVNRKKMFWIEMAELRLGRELAIPFRITDRLAQKLKGAAGILWPVEPVA